MSMKDILQKLDLITESTVTPVSVKHGLNQQQKGVKQMPALFKSKDISPVLSGPYGKKHPAQGYLVGANEAAGDATGYGVETGDDGAEETPDGVSPDTQTFLDEELDESRMSELDIEYQDWKSMSPVSFQNRYNISKDAWKAKYGNLVNPSQEKTLSKKTAWRRPGGADYCNICNRDSNRCICESEDHSNPVERAILHRIMMQHTGLLAKYGPELIMDAVAEVADFVGDVEEIGSSDVSGWVRQVEDYAKRMHNQYPEPGDVGDALDESAKTTEDIVSSVKKKLGDYLADLSKEIKQDPDLKDKVPQDIDKISPAVKTITTDDGKEIKIHGNEDDGFRITIKNKEIKSRFDNLDEAVLACEMFMNRRRSANVVQEVQPTLNNNDYVEEKK